jgi:hypothetical protein
MSCVSEGVTHTHTHTLIDSTSSYFAPLTDCMTTMSHADLTAWTNQNVCLCVAQPQLITSLHSDVRVLCQNPAVQET